MYDIQFRSILDSSTGVLCLLIFSGEDICPQRCVVYSVLLKTGDARFLRAYRPFNCLSSIAPTTAAHSNQLRISQYNPDCFRKSDIGCLNFYANPSYSLCASKISNKRKDPLT